MKYTLIINRLLPYLIGVVNPYLCIGQLLVGFLMVKNKFTMKGSRIASI